MKKILVILGFLLLAVQLQAQPGVYLKEANPIVKVELSPTPFYDQAWFNTIIAALLGIGGTVLGFQLNAKREDKRRLEDKKELELNQLRSYKTEAAILIPQIKDSVVEMLMGHYLNNKLSNMDKTDFDSNGKNGLREMEAIQLTRFVTNKNKYLETISLFRKQVEYFETYLGENKFWNNVISGIDKFSLNPFVGKDSKYLEQEIERSEEIGALVQDLVNKLERLCDFMNTYISYYKNHSSEETKTFLLNSFPMRTVDGKVMVIHKNKSNLSTEKERE